jgi:hypothetical protein
MRSRRCQAPYVSWAGGQYGTRSALHVGMKTLNDRIYERMMREDGAAGYIFLWLLGVPASVLFAIFLLRGCN